MIKISDRYRVGFTSFGLIWFDLEAEFAYGKTYPCSKAAAVLITAPDSEWKEKMVVPVHYGGVIVVVSREQAIVFDLKETQVASWS